MFIIKFFIKNFFMFFLGMASPFIAYHIFDLTVPGLGSKAVVAVTQDVASTYHKGHTSFTGLIKKGTSCRKHSIYKNNMYMKCIVKVPEDAVSHVK